MRVNIGRFRDMETYALLAVVVALFSSAFD